MYPHTLAMNVVTRWTIFSNSVAHFLFKYNVCMKNHTYLMNHIIVHYVLIGMLVWNYIMYVHSCWCSLTNEYNICYENAHTTVYVTICNIAPFCMQIVILRFKVHSSHYKNWRWLFLLTCICVTRSSWHIEAIAMWPQFRTKFLKASSWMKISVFYITFYNDLFLYIQLSKCHRWFR